MPAIPRVSRERWILAGLEALVEAGPSAVRVETLASRLGVTKGGFYGYFDNRDALMDAMLEVWERRSTDDAIAIAEAEGRDVRETMHLAGALTFSVDLLPIDLAVRAWARHDPAVAERLRRVDNVRIEFLRAMFRTYIADDAEIEARSTLAFATAIGQHFMAADHGAYTKDEAVDLAAALVLRPSLPD
ncbi:TetR/AcrR family transcriptional regulator [Mumia zhuanghuii]|uniref:TetR/AcrR family transcriptional regulator n=1 Tax=Mumia zhuanghuii TaxID=2585211 RepID=A0A5C4MN22_9ACTN|nr:TetR/AcrR family transcriptional regulator [Mumia zhuanghuii]TNC43093.1 TetR/AcrR family transcriptional regulator [Mumia zhuanghuii]TNC46040.1 TetR/AcrR family transcriptional regulator [Mumia zhuanghuii]